MEEGPMMLTLRCLIWGTAYDFLYLYGGLGSQCWVWFQEFQKTLDSENSCCWSQPPLLEPCQRNRKIGRNSLLPSLYPPLSLLLMEYNKKPSDKVSAEMWLAESMHQQNLDDSFGAQGNRYIFISMQSKLWFWRLHCQGQKWKKEDHSWSYCSIDSDYLVVKSYLGMLKFGSNFQKITWEVIFCQTQFSNRG